MVWSLFSPTCTRLELIPTVEARTDTGGEDFRLNGAGAGAGGGDGVCVAVRSVLACGSRSAGGGLAAGLVMAAGMVPSAAGAAGGGDCAK
jgi:hypothetical protein